MYALVLEEDGYEFLVDPADLWKPPRVTVRRGRTSGIVWLDEDDVSFMKSRFGAREEQRIVAIVKDNIDDLLAFWASLKNDVQMDRLDRNLLVD